MRHAAASKVATRRECVLMHSVRRRQARTMVTDECNIASVLYFGGVDVRWFVDVVHVLHARGKLPPKMHRRTSAKRKPVASRRRHSAVSTGSCGRTFPPSFVLISAAVVTRCTIVRCFDADDHVSKNRRKFVCQTAQKLLRAARPNSPET